MSGRNARLPYRFSAVPTLLLTCVLSCWVFVPEPCLRKTRRRGSAVHHHRIIGSHQNRRLVSERERLQPINGQPEPTFVLPVNVTPV